MNRLRNRLILIFLAATLAPLAATMWYTAFLLKPTPFLRAAEQVNTLSESLKRTSRELYQRDAADLKAHAQRGDLTPQKFTVASRESWPDSVREFAESGQPDRFDYTEDGSQLDYLLRRDGAIWVYSAHLNAIEGMRGQIATARELVDVAR